MDNFLDKIFFRSRNLNYISQNLIDLTNQTPANKIFEALNTYSHNSEVRYVGGCIRKIIKKDILLSELNNYDEIILVGSGKGVASVYKISQIGWKRKNLNKYNVFQRYYLKAKNKCNFYKF